MSLDYTSSDNNKIGDYLIQELYDTEADNFSEIMTGIHIPTKEKVSIKIINKENLKIKEQKKKLLLTEILLLKKMKHRNIIKLYEIIKTHEKVYLIMEYCNSDNIYDTIDNRGPRPEKQACLLFQQILDLLLYLKSQKIFQVNINPENILLDINNKNVTCKLKNFQKSKKNYKKNENNSMIYNAGVLLYYIVCGYFPFSEEDSEEESENSSLDIQEDLSHSLSDLLKHLLDKNLKKIYSLEQITKHPWFNIIKYIPRPGITMGKHKIPVDYQIVKQCEFFGYDKWKVIESVEKNNYDKYSAVYYILLKKLEREGVGSISDLYSEKYLEYINIVNDFLNKNENIDKEDNEKDNDSDNDDNRGNKKNNKNNKKSYSKTERQLKNRNKGTYSDSDDSDSSDESESDSDDKNKNKSKKKGAKVTKRKIIKILKKSKMEKEKENKKKN
jgi:serine/threonine protein kinase